jgi:SAM-dependent methyltransferase
MQAANCTNMCELRSSLAIHVSVKFEAAANMHRHWSRRTLYEERACANLRDGAAVVSIGEGTGEYLLALAQRFPGLRFIGFDLDPARVATAEKLRRSLRVTNAEFAVANALSLPLRDKTADFIYSRCVFQFVTDKNGFLREVGRIAGGGIHIAMIRNNPQCTVLMRIRGIQAALLRGADYSDWVNPARDTEAYLKEINAYRSFLWYRALIRRHFPEARMIGTHRLWTDTGRPVSALAAFFSQSIGFEISAS